jgi:hypothetical protein
MITEYTGMIFSEIEKATARAQRDLRRGVYPKDVMCLLPYGRAEGSLRRDMYAMYRHGRLLRLGGEGARKGYRLPTLMERQAFCINRGLWPYGAERVQVA